MIEFFTDRLIPLLQEYGLLAIFITMALESACILIPSEIVVPYGGVLAALGHVRLWQVVVVAVTANLVGSLVAYAVGRYGGRAFIERYGRYILISHHHLDKADEWFSRRGELTVFLTRMMPGIRTFISVPAGIGRMGIWKFALYSVLGAVPWNLALALLGWYFGSNWGRLQGYFHQYNLWFFGVLVAVVMVLVALRVARRRRQQVPSEASEEP
ncbi:MAG: DedA family protein [Actinobacteria bacterium]|nr:DedA family protein [Actinomycetota bacterium]